jgi:hypothetical protein
VVDVSGHGASSAIIMAMIRAAFHAYSSPAVNPGEGLEVSQPTVSIPVEWFFDAGDGALCR